MPYLIEERLVVEEQLPGLVFVEADIHCRDAETIVYRNHLPLSIARAPQADLSAGSDHVTDADIFDLQIIVDAIM